MSKLIDGKAIAKELREELKSKIERLKAKGKTPGLAVVLAGSDPASEVYVKNKIAACEQTGIKSFAYYLPEHTSQGQLEELVSGLAQNSEVDGILVQLPLPRGLDESRIIGLIPPEKDVDGFTAENVGRLMLGGDTMISCTPYGVMKLLEHENIELSGKSAVVVGRSNNVGKPMALLLLQKNATVTVCHSKTANLKEVCQNADILIAAIGKPKFITEDMVKSGAVVIDIGINRVDGKLCGDVDFEKVKEKTSYITPVPGGVGPMTITMLLYNTYKSAAKEIDD